MSFITKNMYFTVSVFSKDCMSGYIHSPVLKENIEFKAMLTHRDAMIKNVFEYIKNIVLLMVYTYYYKC